MPSPNLVARRLRCGFDDLALLDAIDVEVAAGDCLQLGGANGSGKTTLLRSLAGMLPAVAGDVLWCGLSIHAPDSDYFSCSLFCGHRDAIYPNLSVRDNLAWQFNMRGSYPSATQLDGYLAHFALDSYAEGDSTELSFGQRRKLQLAYLLGSSESLWLLDEPFTGLDADSQIALARVLQTHQERGGMCVFSSHQPAPEGLFSVSQKLTL